MLTRRQFIQSASAAALVAGIPNLRGTVPAPARFKNLATGRRLRIAGVGVGNRGGIDTQACAGEEIVALCDVDAVQARATFLAFPAVAQYRDFRKMLDELHDRIDAVTVSTPDHMHFPVAMMAIERGKHVFVQKPLAHTIGEAQLLKAAAARAGVVTQMGNQGQASEGALITKEWIDAGVIGPVREVHCWTNRPIWPQGVLLPDPVTTIPETLDWNLWQGVAPERRYSPQYVPFKWRGYWDYGCGALGDMGCHVLNNPFLALDLRGPVRVSAQCAGASEVAAPRWSVITYEYPARGSRPPVKLVWYDGGKLPPVPAELGPGGKLARSGAYYRGDRGTIMDGTNYGTSPRLIPEEKMQAFTVRPPKILPRVKGGIHADWIAACKGEGPAPCSNFVDHAADLTELVLLGNVAIRSGKPIDWDPVRGVCVGAPEMARFIHKKYRLF
jgi:predicted dehydrogenase